MHSAGFINVFRDITGELHYSSEEFALGQQGLDSFEAAISDAYRHSLLGSWRYVCTLAPDADITREMQDRLAHLEHAKAVIEQFGKPAGNYSVDEIEDEAFSL